MRFKNLGSGSTGNATLVESGGQNPFRLLVDCGLGIRQLQARLAIAGLQTSDIHAIFITHEHADHIGCARSLALKMKIPVWMSQGTHAALREPDFADFLHIAKDGQCIDLGGLQIMPFTVPHDAREPLQLTCSDGASRLGILTDLGHVTAHVTQHLAGCDALLLESNHDSAMLENSVYPYFLKQRISGQHGHLSNLAAANLVREIAHSGLKHLVAAHLSEQNNRPELVQQSIADALNCEPQDILVASPTEGTSWLQF
jgi:phosphoribosyl 1,2-cyclic phosphodiesterase